MPCAGITSVSYTHLIGDVADGICKKLIYRHPHIFGSVEVGSSEEILRNWDELKRKEKHQETDTSALESVAKSLPGLIRAEKPVSYTHLPEPVFCMKDMEVEDITPISSDRHVRLTLVKDGARFSAMWFGTCLLYTSRDRAPPRPAGCLQQGARHRAQIGQKEGAGRDRNHVQRADEQQEEAAHQGRKTAGDRPPDPPDEGGGQDARIRDRRPAERSN